MNALHGLLIGHLLGLLLMAMPGPAIHWDRAPRPVREKLNLHRRPAWV